MANVYFFAKALDTKAPQINLFILNEMDVLDVTA